MPQLSYVPAEGAVFAAAEESGRELAYPGSLAAGVLGSASGIAWRPALQAAILLAIPASVLSAAPIGFVCMAGASAWAVHLYAKRIHASGISTGAGARIGLVTGLMASWLSVGLDGFFLWLARFPLHQGSAIDSMWATVVLKPLDQKQQEMAQAGVATPQTIEFAHHLRDFMTSSNGKAAMTMMSLCVATLLLILFATVGGALGARLSTQTRRPST